ncbi:MAG TPA: CRISPR-associated protein Cas4 [Pyrinomonadaceae bacterium]|jgi:CRISPR-associated exonuclease Cas4|nr:CRISPR-associated protein Cas4 [Pyrinomonadaceae bacterium]
MSYLLLVIPVLLVVALIAHLAAQSAAARTGLPAGQLIYSDTGYAVGHVNPVTTNEQGEKQERPLTSRRYGLSGRPDYLVRTGDGIVPVEAKSAMCPASGRAYDSHVFQLAAYCLLVEDVLDADVPYGIIRYADAEILIDYTAELKDELLELLDEMREARVAEDVHRSHNEARRCSKCSMREICDEALA